MEVAIKLEGDRGVLRITDVPSLEVARLVAGCCGFYDVDVEPGRPGVVSIIAMADKRTIRTNGTTVYDACEKLIALLAKEETDACR